MLLFLSRAPHQSSMYLLKNATSRLDLRILEEHACKHESLRTLSFLCGRSCFILISCLERLEPHVRISYIVGPSYSSFTPATRRTTPYAIYLIAESRFWSIEYRRWDSFYFPGSCFNTDLSRCNCSILALSVAYSVLSDMPKHHKVVNFQMRMLRMEHFNRENHDAKQDLQSLVLF